MRHLNIYNPIAIGSLFLLQYSLLVPVSLRMLKIGVFGTGHLGKFHLNNWKEIPGIELVGFFDPDDKIAADIVSKYGLKR
ncbi:MAG: Gfo/Idh/MocA family oxidoreductase, partial [Flavisolibacter sp.]